MSAKERAVIATIQFAALAVTFSTMVVAYSVTGWKSYQQRSNWEAMQRQSVVHFEDRRDVTQFFGYLR
jgi:hypothetical protein